MAAGVFVTGLDHVAFIHKAMRTLFRGRRGQLGLIAADQVDPSVGTQPQAVRSVFFHRPGELDDRRHGVRHPVAILVLSSVQSRSLRSVRGRVDLAVDPHNSLAVFQLIAIDRDLVADLVLVGVQHQQEGPIFA